MIKLSKNQEGLNKRGRPRMDSWRKLPTILDSELIKIYFFDFIKFSPGNLNRLPDMAGIEFRDRFTAAFLRYLVLMGCEPEMAVDALGRSWRQFQRYLVGGDQIPKTDVVKALAEASGVPIDWIVGGTKRAVGASPELLVELDVFDLELVKGTEKFNFTPRAGQAQFPADVIMAAGIDVKDAKLIVVKSDDNGNSLAHGDLLLLDTNQKAWGRHSEQMIDLLVADADGETTWLYRETGYVRISDATHSAPLTLIGRIGWIGRRFTKKPAGT